jgi:hypothetical protein
MKIKITSSSRMAGKGNPIEVIEIGKAGKPGQLIIHNGMLYIYSETGETLIDGGVIYSAAILANSITSDKLTIGSQQFTHDIVWTATDINTCSWSAGTIYWSNGTTSSINSGNTGNITETTYIYYDGTDTLKTTTTPATVVSDTARLLAIVELGGTGGKCIITPINSVGTTIDANKIVTGKIQSIDLKTYFDLNNNKLIVNDGTTDRILIGKRD